MKAGHKILQWLTRSGSKLRICPSLLTGEGGRAMCKTAVIVDETLMPWISTPAVYQMGMTETGRPRRFEPARMDWPRPKIEPAREVLPDGSRTGAFVDLNEGAKGSVVDVDEVQEPRKLE